MVIKTQSVETAEPTNSRSTLLPVQDNGMPVTVKVLVSPSVISVESIVCAATGAARVSRSATAATRRRTPVRVQRAGRSDSDREDKTPRRRHHEDAGRAARRLGGSAARRLGGSAARRLGGSAARRLGGSAAHFNHLVRRQCQEPPQGSGTAAERLNEIAASHSHPADQRPAQHACHASPEPTSTSKSRQMHKIGVSGCGRSSI